MTAQFGKYHLGDRDEHLPTAHGFDEFFGSLYHIFLHLKKEGEGKTGLGVYPDGMVEHDGHIGQILDKLKELGLEENTIVMYSTDNGAEKFTWPDGGTSPFRGEKNENWEGGYRVPCAIRWPGVIKPGTVNNDLFSHEETLVGQRQVNSP